jgi:hypothetical protein
MNVSPLRRTQRFTKRKPKTLIMNEVLPWDAATSGKPLRHERRLKFSDEVNDFFTQMERDHGMPASNLADMLLKTCIPQFQNKRYTVEGIVGLWRERKF